jgi:tetratricopeptide (TPR) repeat protein
MSSAQFNKALAAYDKAIENKPKNEDAWLHKASILLATNRNDEALALYNRAIENPHSSEAWRGKASVLYALGKYNEAQKAYEKGK